MRLVATSSDVSFSLYESFERAMQSMGGFEHDPDLAVAVSGGADSIATALCAQRWAKLRGGKVSALIVDHGLRVASRGEAIQAQQWLQQQGIASHILTLSLRGTHRSIQETARRARYEALMQWCRQQGVLHLLLGHHADDQAETILFRWLRHSGFSGLAGMSMMKEWHDVRVLRPLLMASKQDCRAYLQSIGQAWIEDESNDNRAFTRVRLRQFLQYMQVNGRLSAVANTLGRCRAQEECRLAYDLMQHVTLYPYGMAQMKGWLSLPDDVLQALISRILVTINGSVQSLRDTDVSRLLSWLREANVSRRTLHGCVIEFTKSHGMLVYQEHPSTQLVRLNQPRTHWDRFLVCCEDSHPDFTCSALGKAGWYEIRGHVDLPEPMTVPMAYTLPAIRHLEEVLCVPHIHYRSDRWVWSLPQMVFNPAKPLAGAPFYAMNKGQ